MFPEGISDVSRDFLGIPISARDFRARFQKDKPRTYFTPFSSFSIVKFEHVNTDWILLNFEE